MKMTKLDQLKDLVVTWRREHRTETAVKIAELLDKNLDCYISDERPELIEENDDIKVYRINSNTKIIKLKRDAEL